MVNIPKLQKGLSLVKHYSCGPKLIYLENTPYNFVSHIDLIGPQNVAQEILILLIDPTVEVQGSQHVTEQLVRKRSEHNEGEISTLEELSLHQENIDKIENIQNWCRDLQILLLQGNIISKIENLNKLKCLQYLNLALNNLEKIENLQRCESLEKLDVTLNFIGDLESVCSLRHNYNLKHLYMTGNPCTEFYKYREYVIANLPLLQTLDCKEITRSERLKALQNIKETERRVKLDQARYAEKRQKQKEKLSRTKAELDDDEFWKQPSENAPETRVEIAEREMRAKMAKEGSKNDEKKVKPKMLFKKSGEPFNVNEAKIDFTFSDANPVAYELDVAIYKFMDTNLVDVDLQPNYVRVTIKGKILQLVLPQEISIDKSTAQRSQTTGHLLIKMPLMNPPEIFTPLEKEEQESPPEIKHEYLEVTGPSVDLEIVKKPFDDDEIPDLI